MTHSIGYELGQLRAALEHARREALGGEYRGIKSTAFGSAMTLPAQAFPPLLTAYRGHLANLSEDTATVLDIEVSALMEAIEEAGGFPAHLGPADQADFGLGFHTWTPGDTTGADSPDPVTALNTALIALPSRDRLAVLNLLPPVVDAATQATVAELRTEGATWEEIGRIMGSGRQVAQRRFGTTQGDPTS